MAIASATNVILVTIGLTVLAHSSLGSCGDDLQYLIDNNLIFITIEENMVKGTMVKNVTADIDQVKLVHNPADLLLEFKDGAFFTIVNITLDGEDNKVMCDSLRGLEYSQVTVQCQNGTSIGLEITSSYSDDFSPRFPSNSLRVSIPERSSSGSEVINLKRPEYSAKDDDCRTENILYGIETGDTDVFTISSDGVITLRSDTLDFERQQEYVLNVSVRTDVSAAGTPYRTAYTAVIVSVTDVDDMPPIFDFTEFILNVTEETDLSSTWLVASPQVRAHDGDVGINTSLVYTIISAEPHLDIEMNNATGEIRIHSILDREKVDNYRLVIKAVQENNTVQSATATLLILVEDVNDNRPKFVPNLVNLTIQEDTPNRSPIMILSASDNDLGTRSQLTYDLHSDTVGAFNVTTDSLTDLTWLIVVNTTALRGQRTAMVKVRAVETDPVEGGDPCDYIDFCVLHIVFTIRDVNDNSPQFGQQSYRFTVRTDKELIIGSISATDLDRDDNGNVTYNLVPSGSSPDCDKVRVDAISGELAATESILTGGTCIYTLSACDNPEPPSLSRCSSVPLVLEILANTGGVTLEYTVSVQENLPMESFVTQLQFDGLVTNSSEFKVVGNILKSDTLLDRESMDSYNVYLFLEDTDTKPAFLLHVAVDDVNDNSPIFLTHLYEIELYDNITVGYVVMQVNATDSDAGSNAVLNYSLGSGSQWFSINAATGEISVDKLPVLEEGVTSLEISVIATDSGQPRLLDTSVLKVFLVQLNTTSIVLLPLTVEDIEKDSITIAAHLSEILSVPVTIISWDGLNTVDAMGSKVYITAKTTDGQTMSSHALDSLIEKHASSVYERFRQPDQNGNDDLFSPAFIALLCVCVALLLVIIILVILLWRSKRRNKRSLGLVEKLTRDTTIYDNTLNLARKDSSSTNNNSNHHHYGNGYTSMPEYNNNTSSVTHNNSNNNGDNGDHTSHHDENHLLTNEMDILRMNGFENPAFCHSMETPISGEPDHCHVEPHANTAQQHPGSHKYDERHYASIGEDGVGDSDRVTSFASLPPTSATTTVDTASGRASPVYRTIINVQCSHDGRGGDKNQLPAGNGRPRGDEEEEEEETTPRSERRNSEADSGLPSDRENQDTDDDKEVAVIMNNQLRRDKREDDQNGTGWDIQHQFTSELDRDILSKGSVELNTLTSMAAAPSVAPPPVSSPLIPVTPSTTSIYPNISSLNAPPEEPLPDYAKKVRFQGGSPDVVDGTGIKEKNIAAVGQAAESVTQSVQSPPFGSFYFSGIESTAL